MAIKVYTIGGKSFPQITPANFVLNYNQHWRNYAAHYRGGALFVKANVQVGLMVTGKTASLRPFISSDIEIRKILKILGPGFADAYAALGIPGGIGIPEMLGMQLFEFCVSDTARVWWYFVPKPILNGHLLPHSHYHL